MPRPCMPIAIISQVVLDNSIEMAAGEQLAPGRAFRPSEDELIALLRILRAGDNIPFVHRADVYSAAPADLVANLRPAPGTDKHDDGYNSVWYLFGPKKYKSAHAKPGGKKQRAVAGGGGACWHPETGAKKVEGSAGGVSRTLSYGRKEGRTFTRLGWCMVEFGLDDEQQQQDGYVLCKVYRSCRAKEKSLSRKSASSTTEKTAVPTSGNKRKAAGGDHIEARPAKLSLQQVKEALFIDEESMPYYKEHHDVDDQEFYEGEMMYQIRVEPEVGGDVGEFVETTYGSLASQVAGMTVDELLGTESSATIHHRMLISSRASPSDVFTGLELADELHANFVA